jgi:ABC-type transport system involved in multi-copper enzyme maturation permease subunit
VGRTSGTSEFTRLVVVAGVSFRGALRGLRAVGLAAFALIPSLIVLALTGANASAASMEAAAQALFGVLTLPIVVMVVVLVLAVAQFRNEIDSETLVYLTDRSVRRSTVVLGKYFGAWLASLVLVVPAALVPLAIAGAFGAPLTPAGVPFVALAATALASAVYVGFFLFLGLVSSAALMIGLVFGFIWEELLLLLPGTVPELTVSFYVRCFISGELRSGPLSTFSTAVPASTAVAVLLGVAGFFVVASIWALRSLETAPERTSA